MHKITYRNKYLCALLATALLSPVGTLLAQTPAGETKPGPETAAPGEAAGDQSKPPVTNHPIDTEAYYRRPEKHRVRLLFGAGQANLLPGIHSEVTSSWFINNAIRNAIEPTYPAVVPLSQPSNVTAVALHGGLEYTFADRFTATYNLYKINQRFSPAGSGRADFFVPATTTYQWSYFEGLRLVKYREEHNSLEFSYLHPVLLQGFKAGLFVGREWYLEKNDVSLGSYIATRTSSTTLPDTISWSAGAIIPTTYTLSGWVYGPMLRYEIFDWFGVMYRLTPITRQGSFSFAGLQALNQIQQSTGASQVAPLLPAASGELTDKGIRHNFEAVVRIFCRYSIHLGVLQEDLKRSYSEYYGYTFANAALYSMKTPTGIGIGETLSSHKIRKLEYYLKFGVAFYY